MKPTPVKATAEKREEKPFAPQPQQETVSPQPAVSSISSLQFAAGNASVAAIATTSPATSFTTDYLPTQSMFGNAVAGQVAENTEPTSLLSSPVAEERAPLSVEPQTVKPDAAIQPQEAIQPERAVRKTPEPVAPESPPVRTPDRPGPKAPTTTEALPEALGPSGEVETTPLLKSEGAGEEKPQEKTKGKGKEKGAERAVAGELKGGAGDATGAVGAGEGETAEEAAPEIDTTSFEGMLQSLADTPPSASAAALTMAETATPNLQAKEKSDLKESFPEVERPTGLPRLKDRTNVDPLNLKEGKPPELEGEKGREGEPPDVEHKLPDVPLPGKNIPTEVREPAAEEDEGSWWERLFNRIRKFTSSLPTRDPGVSTDAGPRPSVDMTGEANPEQTGQAQATSTEEVGAKNVEAGEATKEYFGENDVYPDVPQETLRPSYSPTAPTGAAGTKFEKVEGLTAGEKGMFDQSTGPWYAGKVGEEQEKHRVGKEEYDAQSDEAREEGNRRMVEETEKTRVEQEAMQGAARSDVDAERGRWREENQKIQDTYLKQSEEKRKEVDTQVTEKATQAEKDADAKLTEAEKEAKQKKKEAEEKAAEEKRKEEAKPRSWWQKVKGAVSSVLNAIKKVVNAIFDGLRALVKGIFELAKKLVRGIIELARMAIVGLIKAFGAILKGLVTIALAAFPEAAKKARAWIDDRVDQAVTAVNKAAEMLKKATDAILDFVASTLDSILGIVQSIQNAILTVVGMLITGEIFELIKRIGYLVSAAKTAPGQFETAALEELLGGNLDEPLSPGELQQAREAGITVPGSKAEEGGPAETADPSQLPTGPPWGDHNVGVDAVDHNMELSPELAEELHDKTNGEGEVELGSSEDETRTMDSVMSEVGTEGGETATTEQVKNPDDGLSPTQRAEIKWEVMKDGIAKWWSENWPTIILAAAAALLGFIALNIVTGGAIAAALPAILAIVGPLFIGLTVLKLAEYVKNYVELGWDGQIRPAGKNLAKALAAGAIELISYITFKAAGAALKGAKALAKGGMKLASGGLKVAKAGAKAVARGAKFVIEKGKVLFRGIAKTGVGKLAKKAKDLGAKLLEKLRFKKFRITISGRRFRLEGFINPWILLADGTIEEVTFKGQGRVEVGEAVTFNGRKGFVVGVRDTRSGSKFVQELGKRAKDPTLIKENKALFKQLSKMEPDEAKKLLGTFDKLGFNSTTEAMRGAVQGKPYMDPITGKMVKPKPGVPIEPDHTFPVEKMMDLKGWDKLTDLQKKAIVYDQIGLDNIKPLPKALNRSKGSRFADAWKDAKGVKIDPAYTQWLKDEQERIRKAIEAHIKTYLST